jgi:thiamine-monophosphate kinase
MEPPLPQTTPSEFELIARLTHGLPRPAGVAVGIGDDAAVLDCPSGSQIVATCDALVEGSHFVRDWATPEQVGRRALAVNLSDIAAMGGEPLYALISLAIPPTTPVEWLDGLYRGLRNEADLFGVAVVGGNVTSIAGPLVVDVTMLGRVAPGQALLRSGARPGDRLCVTGTLGGAAVGLYALWRTPTKRPAPAPLALERVRAALLLPNPRVAEGQALAAVEGVSAMIDVSDGLAADLSHICALSGVGAVVDAGALPVDEATAAVAHSYGQDVQELALHGGEDYELLFAVHPEAETAALQAVRAVGGSATTIGWCTDPASGLRLRTRAGALAPLEPRGWDHLSRQDWAPNRNM